MYSHIIIDASINNFFGLGKLLPFSRCGCDLKATHEVARCPINQRASCTNWQLYQFMRETIECLIIKLTDPSKSATTTEKLQLIFEDKLPNKRSAVQELNIIEQQIKDHFDLLPINWRTHRFERWLGSNSIILKNMSTIFIPQDISNLYEVYNYRNAAQILATTCPYEFQEILDALREFRLTLADIRKPGGNESDIPKRISGMLRMKGWMETRIKGDLVITKVAGSGGKKAKDEEREEEASDTLDKIEELEKRGYTVEHITRENFLDGHKVDYVKNRVAFDLEWNSKDQTFDRDLYAFRAFYECDLIDAAILLTRSASLNLVFDKLGPELDDEGNPKMSKNGKPKLVKTKYGASTTWMGKLLSRLNAGRHGGCPVLALGITPNLITDWSEYEKNHP